MSDRKNGYYICYETDEGLVGVDKKINNQVKIFNQYFNCQKIAVPKDKKNLIKSLLWRMPFGSYGRNYEQVFEVVQGEPEFFYIRFAPVDRRFLRFIKKLRERFPSAKLLIEIPTYPYKGELLGSLQMMPFYYKDLCYRGQLKKYIDRIVTLTDDKYIFGIPAIHIMNGIIVDDMKVVESLPSKSKQVIRLLAVAVFQKSHGYERVIKGLSQFYKENNDWRFELYFVGSGRELRKYKKLVKRYGLQDYVTFCGKKTGDALDSIYDNMDIALGPFGLYKRKIYSSSSLKIREYLAKGMPIISGCFEDAFEQKKTYRYYLEFPNNNTTIDMRPVIKFYTEIYKSGMTRIEVSTKIREYAKRTIDLSITMKPIIKYVEG